jgi:hypothetical protein
MLRFKQYTETLLESSKSQFVKDVMKRYKLPEDIINIGIDSAKTDGFITIKIPDGLRGGIAVPSDIPGILQLQKDLKSGNFFHPRLARWDIYDTGSPAQISIVVANKKMPAQKKLYHFANTSSIDSIMKNGLKFSNSKAANWRIGNSGKAAYSDAIFLVKKPKTLWKLRGFQKFKTPEFTLLEIQSSSLELWKDPNYFSPDPESFVIFGTNISPDLITVKS